MRTAVAVLDVVGECQQVFVVTVVELEGDLAGESAFLVRPADHLHLMQAFLALVHVIDECLEAVLIPELLAAITAIVLELNPQAFVEIREFAQARAQRLRPEITVDENRRIGFELHPRAGPGRLADDFDRLDHLAALEAHRVDLAVALDLHHHPF